MPKSDLGTMLQPSLAKQLILHQLTQRRGSTWLFHDLNLTVEASTALILTGPNGSGKTTLLRTIAGYLKPVAGRVELVGANAQDDLATSTHFLGHLNALKGNMTVYDNLAFWSDVLAADAPALSSTEAMACLNIDHLADIPAGYLSAGQQRRLALARLLVAHRQIWLLDEPTAALDAAGAGIVAGLIDSHTATGGIVIVSTHHALALQRSASCDMASLSLAEAPC